MLSQDEVDALLNAVQQGDVAPESDVAEEASGSSKRRVEPYDFQKPHLISNEQLRGLQIIHDTFAKNLQGVLSGTLRTAFEVKLVAIDQLLFSEFVLSLYNPTLLTVLKMPPLSGNILLEMNLSIVMVIIDRLLGGSGLTVPEPRELTPIELSIAQTMIATTLHELKAAWSGTMHDVSFEVESHDFNPEFIRIAPAEASVLSITLDWRIGESAGVINLCYPFSVIKPLLPMLSAESLVAKSLNEQTDEDKQRMLENARLIPMDLHAILGKCKLPASQVCSLNIGDVICLDKRYDSPIDVEIEGKKLYTAEIGQRRGSFAVRLFKPIEPGEDIED